MKNYLHTKISLFSGPHLLGMLFIVMGVFTLLSPAFLKSDSPPEQAYIIGIIATGLGIMIVTLYEGTAIDFQKKRVKTFTAFMGYRFGKWEALPKIDRVVVIKAHHSITNTPNGISPTLSGTVIEHRVFLYAENPRPVYQFTYSDQKRAVRAAQLLSSNLDVTFEMKEA